MILTATFALAAPGDMVSTASKSIQSVQIQNNGASATYYFTASGGWEAANCGNVQYAYIDESAPGAKAILAAALSSKATGSPLSFGGICGDSGGNLQYLQIRYTTH
jgi:hypothetical protein